MEKKTIASKLFSHKKKRAHAIIGRLFVKGSRSLIIYVYQLSSIWTANITSVGGRWHDLSNIFFLSPLSANTIFFPTHFGA